jgi:hypothetical protein
VSHDFTFWDSDEALEDHEASEIHSSLVRRNSHPRAKPSSKIAVLAQEIQARWPEPPPGREDEWPLASPLDVSESHLMVCLMPSRLWDVWPTLGQLAEQLELIMFDPQQDHVVLPRKLSRKRTRERAKKKRGTNRPSGP